MAKNQKKENLKSTRLKTALEKVTNSYQDELKQFGYSLDSIMIPKGAQDAFFNVKFEIGELQNTKILDVGCGFGHMLDYLQAWDIKAQYTGIDICPEFIDIARQRHPEADFRLLNIIEADIKEKWDWVFLAGALNYATDMPLWWNYVKKMIKRMYDLSTQGVAVDFLSSYVDFKKEHAFHPQPEKIFSFAKTLTRRVALRHDYMPYNFTIFLYRNQDITSNNIFSDYKKKLLPEPQI
jgi:SAM-dependent methyltransferase